MPRIKRRNSWLLLMMMRIAAGVGPAVCRARLVSSHASRPPVSTVTELSPKTRLRWAYRSHRESRVHALMAIRQP